MSISEQTPREETTSEKKERSTLLSEGILLAVGSGVAYLLAYFYEKGFASYFGIPVELVQIDLNKILIFAGIVFGVFVFLILLADMLISVGFFRRMPFSGTTVALGVLGLIAVFMFALFGFSGWKYWSPFLQTFILFLLLTFLWPLITQRGKGSYAEKLRAQEELEKGSPRGLFVITAELIGWGPVLILLFVILTFFISENAGKAEAFNQTEFLVTDTTPEMVVLRIYGENLVCAPFDRSTKEVKSNFRVLKIANDPNLSLNLEKVGPLTLPKPQPASTATVIPVLSTSPIVTPVLSTSPLLTPTQVITSAVISPTVSPLPVAPTKPAAKKPVIP